MIHSVVMREKPPSKRPRIRSSYQWGTVQLNDVAAQADLHHCCLYMAEERFSHVINKFTTFYTIYSNKCPLSKIKQNITVC